MADIHDNPQDPNLLNHLLWTPSSGPNHTLPPADKANGISLIKLCTGAPSRAWTLSKLLLLPPGGNLPIGFGMVVNDLFSWETFLLQLTTQHRQSLASHINGWMQAPWCDHWFNGVRQETKRFVVPVVSWCQIRDTLVPLVAPTDSSDPEHYTFLILMWQGIARLHSDRLAHRTLPTLMDYISVRMRQYFDKHHTVLWQTPELPVFLSTDQFLSYCLCQPSIKDWLRKLDIYTLADVLPAFPWLNDFAPLVIDPAKDYSQVTLEPQPATALPQDEDFGLNEPLLVPQDPTPGADTVNCLQAMFQFTTDSSPTEFPSSHTQSSWCATTPQTTSTLSMRNAPTTVSQALFQAPESQQRIVSDRPAPTSGRGPPKIPAQPAQQCSTSRTAHPNVITIPDDPGDTAGPFHLVPLP